jgi:hypothetical protein
MIKHFFNKIKWQKDDVGFHKNFYSISSDGRVINWIIKNVNSHYLKYFLIYSKYLNIKKFDYFKEQTLFE